MPPFRQVVRTVAVCVCTSLPSACAPTDSESEAETSPDVGVQHSAEAPFTLTPSQEYGRDVFESVCWTCHGVSGRGDGPAVVAGAGVQPPDLMSEEYRSLSADNLRNRFAEASADVDDRHPHMRFVLSFMDRDAFMSALSYVPALAYPAELQGSALAGRMLYERHCAPCHGANGDGRGPAADLLPMIPPALRNDSLIAQRRFTELVDKILQGGGLLHGSPMPAWGMFFDENMAWDVVAYMASLQPGVLSVPPH